MSDSEVEYQSADEKIKAQPAKKKVTTKRKTESCNKPPKPKSSKKRHNTDLFGIEDIPDRPATSSGDLGSSLLSRVANGKVRRTADVIGDFYVEVKVYHKADIISTVREDRWKKAAVALKVQLNKESPQWDTLQAFMRRAHELFDSSEPVYFSDQISFK